MADKTDDTEKHEDKRAAATVITRKGPMIVVNMSEAERSFPIGKYSKILDDKASPAHQIRGSLRLMPGLNILDKAIVNQGRTSISDEDFEAVKSHPDFKRLEEMGMLRIFRNRSQISKSERGQIAALTTDMDALQIWLAAEDDARTRVAIQGQIRQLREDGLDQTDQQVVAEPERTGQSLVL